jgi:hypothetical protein
VLAVVREHKVEYNNTLKLSALRRRSTEELDAEAVAAIEDPQDNPEAAIQNRQTSEILLKCLGRVLINVQISGFGNEAEILCSMRALPVLTLLGRSGHWIRSPSRLIWRRRTERTDHGGQGLPLLSP